MEVKNELQKIQDLQRRMTAYDYAQGVIYYDSATVAPKKSVAGRSDCMALLAEESYKLFVNDEVGETLRFLYEHREELNAVDRRQVELLKEEYDKNFKIPMEEYIAFSVLRNEAEAAWHDAKEKNDFPSFAPYIEKIVATLKRFAGYMDPDKDAYDVWLDEYEKGLTRETCDRYFDEMKAALVPLIHRVNAAPQVRDDCVRGSFDIAKQKELSAWLMDVMTIPGDRCILGETEHPFTSGFNIDDVRITTHYYADDFLSSLFSVVHEGGHGLYDLGADPAYRNTVLAGPRSTSIHESQSRFFENYIARSREFCGVLLPKLQELFPQMAGVTAEELYLAVNRAEPSLIRIEADELTYSMHILIRYEIEKMLFDGKITVAELPQTWNRLYKDYLGVEVPDDKRGVLQDTHWGGGMFGYFPSYSLGSAYAAQMMDAMRKDFDVGAAVAKGDLAPVVAWLAERVHRDGGMPLPHEIIEKACGAPFSAQYYFDYLTKKYTDIYGLN